jgi:hypothetical protein
MDQMNNNSMTGAHNPEAEYAELDANDSSNIYDIDEMNEEQKF